MSKMIDATIYPEILGSMTSDNGDLLLLHVRDADGKDRMLGFPHASIPQIIEMAAVQAQAGGHKTGERDITAFTISNFSLGISDANEVVLTLTIGDNGKVSFLLPGVMAAQMMDTLATWAAKAKSAGPLN